MRNTRKSGRLLWRKKSLHPTIRSGRGSRTNTNTSHQIQVQVIEAHGTGRLMAEQRSAQLIQPGAAAAVIAVGLAYRDRNVTFTVYQHWCTQRWTREVSKYDRSACKQNLYSLSRGSSSPHARTSRALSCTGPRLATLGGSAPHRAELPVSQFPGGAYLCPGSWGTCGR